MRLDDPVLVGPYAAYLLTILFCTVLLKAVESLMKDVKESFKTTIEMFSKELKACQDSRDDMTDKILDINSRLNKYER